SGPMREALSDRERWTAGMAATLFDRAAAMELHSASSSPDALSETLLAGLGLGELWSRRAHGFSRGPSFLLDPSTIPAHPSPGAGPTLIAAAHLIPYRVSLDVARGGIAFSWLEPTLRLLPSLSVDSIANVLDIDGSARAPNGRFPGAASSRLPGSSAASRGSRRGSPSRAASARLRPGTGRPS